MAFDINRMAAAALDTAVNGERPSRKRLSGVRALAAGAALAGLARVAIKRGPELTQLPRLEELAEDVRDRLVDRGWIDEPDEEGYDEDEEEPEAGYDDEDEESDEEEPEAEYDDEDEDYAGEDDSEEEDEDEPDEDDDEDQDFEEDDEPEQAEDSPPPLARGGGKNGDGVDPAERPPEPPKRNQKSKAGRS